jgi:hypothetical protein
MRMWGVDPRLMCNRHLLGEHVEMHMFKGCLDRGKSIKGYIRKGLVITYLIGSRHDALAYEMKLRGFKHKTPMPPMCVESAGFINRSANLKELSRRCKQCKILQNRRSNG